MIRPVLLALAAVVLAGPGCASDRPWKVSPGDEQRFRASTRACEILTDDPDGFEKCMRRRGWRREYPLGL